MPLEPYKSELFTHMGDVRMCKYFPTCKQDLPFFSRKIGVERSGDCQRIFGQNGMDTTSTWSSVAV